MNALLSHQKGASARRHKAGCSRCTLFHMKNLHGDLPFMRVLLENSVDTPLMLNRVLRSSTGIPINSSYAITSNPQTPLSKMSTIPPQVPQYYTKLTLCRCHLHLMAKQKEKENLPKNSPSL